MATGCLAGALTSLYVNNMTYLWRQCQIPHRLNHGMVTHRSARVQSRRQDAEILFYSQAGAPLAVRRSIGSSRRRCRDRAVFARPSRL